jgi:hypothetical protein
MTRIGACARGMPGTAVDAVPGTLATGFICWVEETGPASRS